MVMLNYKLSCVLVFVACTKAVASQPLELRHDPFAYTEKKDKPAVQANDTKPPALASAKWRPQLRATIVAGDRSVANVAGKIVSIGEQLNGFTLINVGKHTATFKKGQQQVVLKMTTKRNKK